MRTLEAGVWAFGYDGETARRRVGFVPVLVDDVPPGTVRLPTPDREIPTGRATRLRSTAARDWTGGEAEVSRSRDGAVLRPPLNSSKAGRRLLTLEKPGDRVAAEDI